MKNLIALGLASVLALSVASAQEYDDLYFSKKDRKQQIAKLDRTFKPDVSTFTQEQQPTAKYANPDYRGGAVVQDDAVPTYNYYDETFTTEADPLHDAYRPGSFSSWNRWNDPFFGGGMMGMGMWNNPWMMRPGFNMGFNTMLGFGMGSGFGMGWGMSPFMGNSMMFGNPWMMDPFMNPWMMDPFMANSMMWGNPWMMSPFGFNRWNRYCPPLIPINNNRAGAISNRRAVASRQNFSSTPQSLASTEARFPSRIRNYQRTSDYVRNQQRSGNTSYRSLDNRTRSSRSYSNPSRRSSFSNPSSSPSFRTSSPSYNSINRSAPSRSSRTYRRP